MTRFEYVIVVWDSTRKVCEHRIPTGQISERNLETLVRMLAARYGKLDDEDVIRALRNRNTRAYRPLLEINKRAVASRFGWVCGHNPYVLVTSEQAE